MSNGILQAWPNLGTKMAATFKDSSETQLVRASALCVITCILVHIYREEHQGFSPQEIGNSHHYFDDLGSSAAIEDGSIAGSDEIWNEVSCACNHQIRIQLLKKFICNLILRYLLFGR